MKILHINTYDSGGAAIAAVRLHKALLKEGVDSKILFTKKTRFDIPESYAYKTPVEGISDRLLKSIGRRLGLYKTIWENNQQKLMGRVQGFEYFSFPTADYDITTQQIYQEADVIHLHWTAGFLDYSFFRKNTKPVAWTLHDMNPFTGGCHNSMGCLLYTDSCLVCPQLNGMRDQLSAKENLGYKRQQLKGVFITIICLSDWMDHLSKGGIFRNYVHYRLDHCIDLGIFKPYPKEFARNVFNLPLEKVIFLTLNERFNLGKGSDIMEEVVNQFVSDDVVFCNAGKSASHPYIQNLGQINDERLLALLYAAVDAVVIPSREENSPNLIVEAFACGTPVIAFRVGGIPDHVKHAENGLLAEDISAGSLKDIMSKFLVTRSKFSKDKIREYAVNHFEMNMQGKKYVNLYHKISSDTNLKSSHSEVFPA